MLATFELCLLIQSWYDHRLTWNASDYGNIRRVLVHSSKIWVPRLLLSNKWEYWNVLIGVPDKNMDIILNIITCTVFGRQFVKRYTLCYRAVVCLSCL